jgi:hypothetical protein
MVDFLWDSVTLLVILGALFYIRVLVRTFGKAPYGRAYQYYFGAVLVLAVGFAIRVAFDFFDVPPFAYGLSVRDPAIAAAVVLMLLGFRESAKFWTNNKP